MTEQAKKKEIALSPTERMKLLTDNAGVKALMQKSLGKHADAFAASIIELYADPNGTLKECDANEVFQEAMKAATLNLPINKNLGLAYVVPYRKNKIQHPQFQIGYKGMIQLAIRSGQYKTINADVVYEGMNIKTNYISGDFIVSGKPTSDKPIGYFAYFELLSGFRKMIYWDVDRVKMHAHKFSKTYQSLEKMLANPDIEQYKLDNNIWYCNFDAMSLKTVLKTILSKYGILSTEMQQAIMEDVDEVHEANIANNANIVNFRDEPKKTLQEHTDEETGEIINNDAEFFNESFKPLDESDAPF